jgi:glucose-6-phosphate dehydrogenase assembly protein OpcA
VIVDLPDTTASRVQRALVKIRAEGGAVALGRVLTLVIATRLGAEEEAIEAANDASREHPMRVIVVSRPDTTDGEARLDAQIRVGGDAGASEVVVLKAFGEAGADEEGLITGMLLPDAPVVAWWPGEAPDRVSDSPIGRIAQRRITDASTQDDPQAALLHLARTYRPGDSDFAWTRLTLWRAILAAVLDQPPFETVEAVEVSGAADSPSTEPNIATLLQPGQPTHQVSLPRRSLRDCLAEELRRLDPDDLFGQVLTEGLPALAGQAATGTGGP